jgi:hypothetical protein
MATVTARFDDGSQPKREATPPDRKRKSFGALKGAIDRSRFTIRDEKSRPHYAARPQLEL